MCIVDKAPAIKTAGDLNPRSTGQSDGIQQFAVARLVTISYVVLCHFKFQTHGQKNNYKSLYPPCCFYDFCLPHRDIFIPIDFICLVIALVAADSIMNHEVKR